MGDELPLEARTIKVRRAPGKKFRLSFNKHGRESSVDWPIELIWETEEPEEDWVGGKRVYHDRGRREVVQPLSWGDLNASIVWSALRDVPPSLVEKILGRLGEELKQVKDSLTPELEKKRIEAAKRAEARLTGKGAEERRTKIVGLLAEALVGLPEGIEPRVLHGVFKTHAEGLFISQVFDSGPVSVEARRGNLERLRENGVSADEAMVAIEAMHGLDMKKSIAHASSNPTHWALVTVDDFAKAIGLAKVKEVLQS